MVASLVSSRGDLESNYTKGDNVKKTVKVGKLEKRKVSKENNELFLIGQDIFDDDANMGLSHMGWKGLSVFVDYILDNYEKKKVTIRRETRG